MQEFICESCEEISQVEFEVKYHPKGVQETYFECDRCGKQYPCFYTDERVRKMQEQLRKSRNAENKTNSEIKAIQHKQEDVNDRMNKLEQSMKR